MRYPSELQNVIITKAFSAHYDVMGLMKYYIVILVSVNCLLAKMESLFSVADSWESHAE